MEIGWGSGLEIFPMSRIVSNFTSYSSSEVEYHYYMLAAQHQ